MKVNTKAISGRITEVLQFASGGFLVGLFGLAILGFLVSEDHSETAALWMCIVLVAVGAVLIFLGCRQHRFLGDFSKYSALLDRKDRYCVEDIASMTNTSVKRVRANLDRMMRRNYFPDAHWDEERQCIIFHNRIPGQKPEQKHVQPDQQRVAAATGESVQMVSVICKSCGGFNKIPKGRTMECEYCGSTIKGE